MSKLLNVKSRTLKEVMDLTGKEYEHMSTSSGLSETKTTSSSLQNPKIEPSLQI